jgi:hypothetical protein
MPQKEGSVPQKEVKVNALRTGWRFFWDYIDLIWDVVVVFLGASSIIHYFTSGGKLWALIISIVAGVFFIVWVIPRDIRKRIREVRERKAAQERKAK